MTIRPVKEDVTQELYEKKAKIWQSKWKRLNHGKKRNICFKYFFLI